MGDNFNKGSFYSKKKNQNYKKPWSSRPEQDQKGRSSLNPNANPYEVKDTHTSEVKDNQEKAQAAELLQRWLPFLSEDMCQPCSRLLQDRISQLGNVSNSNEQHREQEEISVNGHGHDKAPESPPGSSSSEVISSHRNHTSWADIAQEEEDEIERAGKSEEVESGKQGQAKRVLSRDEREYFRFMQVGRKKDFLCYERVNGKLVNILQGLELHTGVFSAVEQKRIVDFIYQIQEQGRKKQLRERTYSEPRKWMKGKGRITIQFGCCYNYAVDKNGNPPGIVRDEEVDPIPPLLKTAIRRLVKWHVLAPSCVPDSCIVNIYEEGDCIPPHIDHHDFVRPFCTISFLSECNIIFGTNLKILAPGQFAGAIAIPLPIGSVLVLNGNGADVAKHSVPSVPHRRISITFRKMDHSKMPFNFVPESDLQRIEPLSYTKPVGHIQSQQLNEQHATEERILEEESTVPVAPTFSVDTANFPPLGGSNSGNRHYGKTGSSRGRILK